MPNTDFFDDDLNRVEDAERRSKLSSKDVMRVGNEGTAAEGVPVK